MFRITSSDEQGRGPRDEGRENTPAPAPVVAPTLGPRPSPLGPQEGYTLAALIVVLTIISIVIAFTVPTQWSLVLRRERERQTIFLMKQFARGIAAWERKHQGLPTSLEMLQKARQPRFLRGTGKWPMPLTGREDDWIIVPPQAVQQPGAPPVPNVQNTGLGGGIRAGTNPAGTNAPTTGGRLNVAASPPDYTGVFVAVRPKASGPSLITFMEADDYSQWVYTLQDLKTEIAGRQQAMNTK